MSVPLRGTLRDLLLRPAAFFDRHPPSATLPVASGVVVVLAVALAASVLLVGSMLAGAVDGTVTVDNPDRPPDRVCERHGDDPDSVFGDGCDEPATLERDAGSLVYEAATDYVGPALAAPFLLWLIGGAVLYVVAWLANGSPSVAGAYALAGWAALPELFRLAVGLLALQHALAGLTITDLDGAVAAVEAAIAPVEPVLALATVLAVVWQWYLLSGGLVRDADLSWSAAATAVGVPMLVWLLVALL